MRSVIYAFLNRRASSPIWACVLVLVFCLLMSVLLQYMGLSLKVSHTKEFLQSEIDDAISQSVREAYPSLRADEAPPEQLLVRAVYDKLGFTSDQLSVTYGDIRLEKPTVQALQVDGFGVRVTIRVTISLYPNNSSALTLPLTFILDSHYIRK